MKRRALRGTMPSTGSLPFDVSINRRTMLRTILLLLVVFILIRLFFPELGTTVQHVLALFLSLVERMLAAVAGRLP